MLRIRRIAIGTVTATLLLVAHANAGSDADTQAAYQAALKCYVANGSAEAERRRAGDPTAAARYDATAKQSFDGAVKLGRMLGYPDRRLNADIKAAEDTEMPRMVKDRSYFLDAVATCKGLGLM